MSKKIAVILICFVALLFSIGCEKKTNESNTLIVGTNSEFPPFTFQINGEIVGFDIDVAREVCRILDKKMVLKDMPFEALLPDLILGNVDFIAAGITYTEERAQRVAFARPHLSNDPLIILTLSQSNFPATGGVEDLVGKTVVVNEGYTADLFLTQNSRLKLLRLSAPADAFVALKNKRADAFVTAQSTLDAFLKTQEKPDFQINVIEGTVDTYALVVSKKNPELLASIQSALDKMEEDGTMTEIKNKWKLE